MYVPLKKYPTIGVCGLDCGLCPRFYTVGKSRCPGCCGPDFATKHPVCSFITCCVKNRKLEVCGQCAEFPCPKFKSSDEYRRAETTSYPPARKVLPNLNFVKEHGIKEFMKEQRRRIRHLQGMIQGHDNGRSRSYYCRAAALLDPKGVESALSQAKQMIRAGNIAPGDVKRRASLLRQLLNDCASREGIELC